jgi:RNA polymerase sigma-70 factor (ECF subfamily)
MFTRDADLQRGLAALRLAVWRALDPAPLMPAAAGSGLLLSEALDYDRPQTRVSAAQAQRPPAQSPARSPGRRGSVAGPGAGGDLDPNSRDADQDIDRATSSVEDQAEAARLIALVELARGGDSEAFGMLYDHYSTAVYRFLYYRVGSVPLAEDLMSETFFRALRSMSSFRWQGKDFGAWLMTIARNLTADHYKSGRTRLELTTEDMTAHDAVTDGPEDAVLASITNDALLEALGELPTEQQECLIMRFLQGLSIAETAAALGRSDGAVKQLQLRGVRNLAKLLPEGLR